MVLDEVDAMLERGFRDQVLQIQTALTQPQILMFSATIPQEIERLSTKILRKPLLISVGKSSVPSEAVKQTVLWVESHQKKKKLFDITRSPQHFHPPVVVFVNSKGRS
jgi:ATP-dependent RNA helicase DDX59